MMCRVKLDIIFMPSKVKLEVVFFFEKYKISPLKFIVSLLNCTLGPPNVEVGGQTPSRSLDPLACRVH